MVRLVSGDFLPAKELPQREVRNNSHLDGSRPSHFAAVFPDGKPGPNSKSQFWAEKAWGWSPFFFLLAYAALKGRSSTLVLAVVVGAASRMDRSLKLGFGSSGGTSDAAISGRRSAHAVHPRHIMDIFRRTAMNQPAKSTPSLRWFFSALAAAFRTLRKRARDHRLSNGYFLPFRLAGGSNAPIVEAFGVIPDKYKPVS
jgi:hypothetical protein